VRDRMADGFFGRFEVDGNDDGKCSQHHGDQKDGNQFSLGV
jgi:hypothetical protein